MRKLGIMFMVLATSLLVFAAVAFADPPGGTNPGDDCSHGINTVTCRPDPNDNGQDCEEHGNGGINEDHCLSTTVPPTTTAPPTTTEPPTTTVPPTCEETQTCETETTTIPPVTTTTETPPVETTTTTAPTEPPATTTTTTVAPTEEPTKSDSSSPSKPGTKNERPGKLAFTGIEDVVPVAAAALGFLSLGSGLMWLGRKREDDADYDA
jgi:hypothetical protein